MERRGIGMIVVWIFVVIAGSMILLLFFLIATSQVQLGKEKLETQAMQQVASVLATQAAADGTHTTVPIPDSSIRMTCTLIGDAYLSQIAIGGKSQNLDHALVAGRDMETGQLTLFTKELWLPYQVGSVLLVSNPQEALVVWDYSENEEAQRTFDDMLPPTVTRHIQADSLSLNAGSHQNTRVVIVQPPDTGDARFVISGLEQANLMVVRPDGTDWLASGRIEFYEKRSSDPAPLQQGTALRYASPEMLLAYVWQGDIDRAKCLESKIAQAAARATDVHIGRMERLAQHALANGDTQCAAMYTTGQLQEYSDAITLTTHAEIPDWSAMANVRTRNEQLLRGSSCATIY